MEADPRRIHGARQRSKSVLSGFQVASVRAFRNNVVFQQLRKREACTDACERRSLIRGERAEIKYVL
jgi:hypothetical protein